MEPQCTHLHREYKPVHNVNAIRQHLECKSQQSTFGMQIHTMRKPLLCTSKQCTSSVWLPRAFRGLVGATCPACPGWLWRPGCCMVATCRTTEIFSLDVVGNVLVAYFEWSAAKLLLRLLCGPAVLLAAQTSSSLQQPRPGCCCVPEACAHEIFCCMLFAVPFLLTSNGQRLKMMPRLLCVPARLLPASQACRSELFHRAGKFFGFFGGPGRFSSLSSGPVGTHPLTGPDFPFKNKKHPTGPFGVFFSSTGPFGVFLFLNIRPVLLVFF